MTAIVVADASVVGKWFLADRPEENDVEAALQLLYAVHDARVSLRQPIPTGSLKPLPCSLV